MTAFEDFLQDRFQTGGFSTEDAIASFLPMAEQVVEAHARGNVAPLEGTDSLRIAESRLWFAQSSEQPIRSFHQPASFRVPNPRSGVDVTGQYSVTHQVDTGDRKIIDLQIGSLDAPVTRPLYLPEHIAWEHRLDCHDPLTDTFSLGMILASMVTGLDLSQPEDLRNFVKHRNNLFNLAEHLHPVVAKAIVQMTALARHARPSDLSAVVHTLSNYRHQPADFTYEIQQSNNRVDTSPHDKRSIVLSNLRNRLFELTRRNRLLHFRPTMQSVNLTQTSVPLSFDIENIRPDQICTWQGSFAKKIAAGKQVSLNQHLNFAETLYLPVQLNRLITETRRDQAEYGFAQLRLVLCFINWSNIKASPPAAFESPLILLPVRLQKKKGIRDTYWLQSETNEAEINPVLRHQFRQLFDIRLPTHLDLDKTDLHEFFDDLKSKIAESEAAIELIKIDRPRIQSIRETAKRRLDRYRRKARVSGKGVRKFSDLDYSYDRANYHPLGIKLFSSRIQPTQTKLSQIIEKGPRPRSFIQAEDPADPETDDVPQAVHSRQAYAIQGAAGSNPYQWTFDLCNVTLANFRYRRMSLVQDYESLLEQDIESESFESTFSLTPRPTERQVLEPHPLPERFDVVPCDPTQALSIAEAGTGNSYIIQGPPGTGKSQTITNLIADYVARGKRVLFVCEKRAAIDVVYARLKQCGLAELCSLIHDSQADKKSFVMDLKQSYESLLQLGSNPNAPQNARESRLEQLQGQLAPLQRFDHSMEESPASVGLKLRKLFNRYLELQDKVPECAATTREGLPPYSEWTASVDAIEQFAEGLRGPYLTHQPSESGATIWATHPLRFLSLGLLKTDQPIDTASTAFHRIRESWNALQQQLQASELPVPQWQSLAQISLLAEYGEHLHRHTEAEQLSLLAEANHGRDARWFRKKQQQWKQLRQRVIEAEQQTEGWKTKLDPIGAETANQQAEYYQQCRMPWLRPGWWKLNRLLDRCYDFSRHPLRPPLPLILAPLLAEQEARQALETTVRQITDRLQITGDQVEGLIEESEAFGEWIQQQPASFIALHRDWIKQSSAGRMLRHLRYAARPLATLQESLETVFADTDQVDTDDWLQSLDWLEANLGQLPEALETIRPLAHVTESLRRRIRTLPYPLPSIEALLAETTLQQCIRSNRELQKFSLPFYEQTTRKLAAGYQDWLTDNAAAIRGRVAAKFYQHTMLTNLPAAKLSAEQKAFKKKYQKGRRILEHEFGKQMRFKPIRDLVSQEAGEVINDLKPVWLMSPLSVSDTLPLVADRFDVVIFDEASQITLEESIPALFRAPQTIIVGDEMQLPPTNFFATQQDDSEDEFLIESEGEWIPYDLDSDSLLTHAAKNLNATMLGWHYRSRSESLISFSNWAFYDGRLLTVPEEVCNDVHQAPIVATTASDGATGAKELLQRSISMHSVPYGVYDKRRNRSEADYIAHLVRELLCPTGSESAATSSHPTIGVIAFSEAQQTEIENALQNLAEEDKDFAQALEAELEREEDGQFVGLLVKNLENIQGDERDIIIMSICYGKPPTGKMRMNFGPINRSGGAKRLNVAFSRAKHHMAVISSIDHQAIRNDYNDGANCLKNYLKYAAAVSTGDTKTADQVLQNLSLWQIDRPQQGDATKDVLAEQIASVLEAAGYQVDRNVGRSHFRCSLAVRRQDEPVYRLGILLDDQNYYEQDDILERDVMRPRLLQAFGWKTITIFAKAWYDDSKGVSKRLLKTLEAID